MPITFTCPCGQTLAVDEEHAGKPVRCPSCQQTPVVPHQLWDSPQHAPGGKPAVPVAPPTPGSSARPWEKGEDTPPPQEPAKSGSFEGGVLNSGVGGGLLAMIGAVVWFVVGLAADTIFFYPPILFVIGLIAFIKGLMQGPSESA